MASAAWRTAPASGVRYAEAMLRLLTPLLLAVLLGCGVPPEREALPIGPERFIVDVPTGEVLSAREAAERLGDVRHVYVGEQHTSELHHRVQLEVLRTLAAAGVDLAVGVEWLPASSQPILDDYLAGRIEEPGLVQRLDWKHIWGHDFANYAPLLRWAREAGVPMWALNAPAGLSARVAQVGVAGLTEGQRKALPPLDTGNEAHREFFRMMMAQNAGHGHHQHRHQHGHGQDQAPALDPAALERYYLAQLVWDESMSRNLAARLASPEGKGKTVVVLAGLGHVDHGHGIPLRAKKLTGLDFAIVLPVENGTMADQHHLLRRKGYPEQRADLLWEAPMVGGTVTSAHR